MNDSTIRLSADTSALTDVLGKIADEMTAMKDAVSSSAAAMGENLDASAKQAEAADAAMHGLDDGVKTVTDSIQDQTKTVTDLGAKQSKAAKEISKALDNQNSQHKDANAALSDQKKILREQEAEIRKVTKAVDSQTGVLKKNASGWKMLLSGFAVKFASETVDMFKSIISTGLEASRVYEDMSARLAPLVGDLETAQKTFWSLNGLEDETATATDKLAKAFVDLGNNGLTNSNELRTSQEDGSSRALEEIKWTGLKSVISDVDHYDNMTVLICRFMGNETLSELSENQLATYWTRKLPAVRYGYSVTADQPPVATRDIAPVVQYIVRNSKYRNILDEDTLMDFDELWRSQGLECNGSIDSDSTLLESLRDVLSCGFAVPVVRDNTLSIKRLYTGAHPVQIFTKSNMTSSPVITCSLPREDDVDEVVVNFTSPQTYKTETVYCHVDADGNKRITDYPESDNQEQLEAWGVTDYDHAVSLGMRRLRYLRNTRVTYEIRTELNGLNCQFNDLVGLMLDENLSNITGRITGISGQTITTDIELPEDNREGIVYISRKDGSYGEYTFYRYDSHTLCLDTSPDLEWDSEFGKSLEYPLFAIGELRLCWVTAVKPESGNRCSLKLINYSEDIFKDDIKEKYQ